MKDDSRCNDNVPELVHILNIMIASVITYYMAKLILWMVKYQLLTKCYMLLEQLGLHIISK